MSSIDKDLVSVIMPAYNASRYIAESIESVIKQSYTHWELLVVDDGSTDSTKEIVQGYISKDPRIKYWWQENGKQGKARNLALANASGQAIAFLDADDLWDEKKLELQVAILNESKADLVFGSLTTFNNLGSIEKIIVPEKVYEGVSAIRDFIEQNQIAILTVLCKKEALSMVNGFSEEPGIQNAEDYHLWIKMLFQNCRFVSHPASLANYRIHDTATTNDDKHATIQVINALLDTAEKHPEWESQIYASVSRRLKNFLFHSKINDPGKVIAISEQLYTIKRLRMSPRLSTCVYQIFGEYVWRKLMLRTSW